MRKRWHFGLVITIVQQESGMPMIEKTRVRTELEPHVLRFVPLAEATPDDYYVYVIRPPFWKDRPVKALAIGWKLVSIANTST